MPSRTLPPELGLLVIDHLGSESEQHPYFELKLPLHIHALRQCALTCRDWLHRSLLNLYRTIFISDQRALATLRTTLERRPVLRAAVRALCLSCSSGLRLWDTMLFMRTMPGVPHLQALCLYDVGMDTSLDKVTRSCLQMRFETVSYLTLSNMAMERAVYILRMRPFPALRQLVCHEVRLNDPEKLPKIMDCAPRINPYPGLVEMKVCGCASS